MSELEAATHLRGLHIGVELAASLAGDLLRDPPREVAPVSWTPERLSFRSPRWQGSRAPYAPEFRRQMIELVRAGRTPEELAKEFEPSAQAIRNWVAQADRDEGRRADGLTTAEREELNRLRRENRQLKLEREILSKAAAWFARETDVIPPKGSNS